MLREDMPFDVSLGFEFTCSEEKLKCNSCLTHHDGTREECRYVGAYRRWKERQRTRVLGELKANMLTVRRGPDAERG